MGKPLKGRARALAAKAGGGHGHIKTGRGVKPLPPGASPHSITRRQWDADDPDQQPPKGFPVGLYDGMKFPPYEYREYPKHVYTDSPDGSYERSPSKKAYVNCHSAEEEAAVLAKTAPVQGTEIVREEDVKAGLIAEADVKGVKVDRRWSAERMQAALDAAAEASKPVEAAKV